MERFQHTPCGARFQAPSIWWKLPVSWRTAAEATRIDLGSYSFSITVLLNLEYRETAARGQGGLRVRRRLILR
jgi:hypothetical protein